MFFVHEMHSLAPEAAPRFEALLKEQWMPALAQDEDMRLVWCVRSLPGAVEFPQLVTLSAVADGAALERFGERTRSGDLRRDMASLDAERVRVERRLLAPLIFDPLTVDLAAIPVVPTDAPDGRSELYIHDLVKPRLGMQRAYEIAMRDVFLKMLEDEARPIRAWAGLETVPGGGPQPESLMISHIGSAAAATRLLSTEVPREYVAPGQWIFDSLKYRDTWTSRLVRSVSWSPLS